MRIGFYLSPIRCWQNKAQLVKALKPGRLGLESWGTGVGQGPPRPGSGYICATEHRQSWTRPGVPHPRGRMSLCVCPHLEPSWTWVAPI